jgi:hypothetical protein
LRERESGEEGREKGEILEEEGKSDELGGVVNKMSWDGIRARGEMEVRAIQRGF